jgi:hypothetical protein
MKLDSYEREERSPDRDRAGMVPTKASAFRLQEELSVTLPYASVSGHQFCPKAEG